MDAILARMKSDGLLDDGAYAAVRHAVDEGLPLEQALREVGGVPEETALRCLAEEFGVPYLDLDGLNPEPELIAEFPARLLVRHGLLPVGQEDGAVLVATSRLLEFRGMDELRLATGRPLRPALAPAAAIARCIKNYLGVGADTMQSLVSDTADGAIRVLGEAEETVDLGAQGDEASIIRFVNQVLTEAIEMRATDVHFEPFEDELRVRYRIDGVLQEARVPAEVRRFQAPIVSRLKILSRLDIAEKRLPQDGRTRLRIRDREIDVRVSVIPMLHGEAVVLRLLDRSSALFGLDGLGMCAEDRAAMARTCEAPHGIVLVTGPTGSGKTTTLYAALSRINDVQRKLITIEDPIEYHLRGINQIQVSTKTGLTFSRGLRSVLRHDPDVILVGEIRDTETADIAVQASLTGHLVFSTLHTNDAPGAITRLMDMGVEPYLVASSLEAVLAQRLVRVICPECHETYAPSAAERDLLRAELSEPVPEKLHRGVGCRECQGTGYRGRTGIFEMMPISDSTRELILRGASAGETRRHAVADGMRSLRRDGWRHVLAGHTTVEEVLRVTKDEPIRPGGGPVGAGGGG